MFCKIYIWPLSHTTYRRCYYKWPDLCHRFLLQFLSLVSLLLSYLSSVSFDSTIETVALEASPSIKYLNKNKSPLYRATMKIILFALTSPLVGKISQSFHLDPFLAFTSLFWGLHLAYFSDQLSPLLTFKGGLDPMTNSLYVSDIAHHHIAVSGLLFWGSSLSRSISTATGLRIFDLIRSETLFYLSHLKSWSQLTLY